MVARGDLGAEVPLEEMTFMQKKMIDAALLKGKYCMVATQALESMIKNPRPTRAEVTDIANSVIDGSGAVTMSGETAYGDYPFAATETMARIMKYTETVRGELTPFVTKPAVKSKEYKFAAKVAKYADKKNVSAIIVLAHNIEIIRAIAAYRPNSLIVPLCTSEKDVRELMMAYGVRPILAKTPDLAAAQSGIEVSDIFSTGSRIVITEKGNRSWKMKTL